MTNQNLIIACIIAGFFALIMHRNAELRREIQSIRTSMKDEVMIERKERKTDIDRLYTKLNDQNEELLQWLENRRDNPLPLDTLHNRFLSRFSEH